MIGWIIVGISFPVGEYQNKLIPQIVFQYKMKTETSRRL